MEGATHLSAGEAYGVEPWYPSGHHGTTLRLLRMRATGQADALLGWGLSHAMRRALGFRGVGRGPFRRFLCREDRLDPSGVGKGRKGH